MEKPVGVVVDFVGGSALAVGMEWMNMMVVALLLEEVAELPCSSHHSELQMSSYASSREALQLMESSREITW